MSQVHHQNYVNKNIAEMYHFTKVLIPIPEKLLTDVGLDLLYAIIEKRVTERTKGLYSMHVATRGAFHIPAGVCLWIENPEDALYFELCKEKLYESN